MPWKKNLNNIFIPATATAEDGMLVLSELGKRRADRAAEAYFDPKCDRAIARIAIAGKCGKDLDFVPKQTESLLTADYMMNTYGISHSAFLLEEESKSTIDNVTFSAIKFTEFFEGALNEEEIIVLASHPYHLARVCLVMCRIGLPKSQLLKAQTMQFDNKMREKDAYSKTKNKLDEMEKRGELAIFSNRRPNINDEEYCLQSTRLVA